MAYIVIAEVSYKDIPASEALKCGYNEDIHRADMINTWEESLRGERVKIFSEPTDGPVDLTCNGLKYYTCEDRPHSVCEHIVDLHGLSQAIEDSKLEAQRAMQSREASV